MSLGLEYKPDFSQTAARFEAWWKGQLIDRPLITGWMKPVRSWDGPAKSHQTLHERWLDAEFQVDCAASTMRNTDYLFDTFPHFDCNLGPVISATLFGCELKFDETTSWALPIVNDPDDWRRVISTPVNFDNIYWRTVERMMDYAAEKYRGKFLVGITDLQGNYAILAALRGTEQLCLDLADDPKIVRRAGAYVTRGFILKRSGAPTLGSPVLAKVPLAGKGSITMAPRLPSCDFWCMVSPAIARNLILPDILTEMQPLERSIFHLDGPGALQYLPLILEIPALHAVQWVYGEGHGPAVRWIEVYRQVRQAGKSIQVLAVDSADALHVLEAVGPHGIWLHIFQPFASCAQAGAFEDQVRRVTDMYVQSTRQYYPSGNECKDKEFL